MLRVLFAFFILSGSIVVADDARTAPEVIFVPAIESICPEGQQEYYRPRGPICAPVFEDAGQVCSNALDCEGHCLPVGGGDGQCAAVPLSFGCTDFFGADGELMTLCIE